MSHRLSVDQSEASPRNSPPYAQYGWKMPRLVETEKYSLLRGAAHQGTEDAATYLGLPLPQVYSRLYVAFDHSSPDFNSVFSNSNIKLPTSFVSIHVLQREYWRREPYFWDAPRSKGAAPLDWFSRAFQMFTKFPEVPPQFFVCFPKTASEISWR